MAEEKQLAFINYLTNDLSEGVARVYEAFFTESGHLLPLNNESVLNALFDLRNKIDDSIEQINEDWFSEKNKKSSVLLG